MEKVNYIDKRQKEYITKAGTDSQKENKNAKLSKKERIKAILKEAGYDPTLKYTSKEKRKFTNLVKNKLFEKPKPVTLTTEEIKKRIIVKSKLHERLLAEREHVSIFVEKRIQKGYTLSELTTRETPNIRTFEYVLQKKSEKDPMKSYDFLTDYFKAFTKEDAKKRATKIIKKYKDDTTISGIMLRDSSNNNIIYYPKTTLLAA